MKITIPRMGDMLVLQKDWSFPVMHEDRNKSIIIHQGQALIPVRYEYNQYYRPIYGYTNHSLPAGTVMSVDRYYIRKGAGEFDSITFYVHTLNGQQLKKKLRFFVSLDAAAQAEFEYLS